MLLTYLWIIDVLIISSDASLCMAFMAVLYQVRTKRSAQGLSLQTLSLVVTARVLHLLSHPFDLHFEPSMLPSWLYSLLDVASAFLGCFVLWWVSQHALDTYEGSKDTFGESLMRRFIWPDAPSEGIPLVLVRAGFSWLIALVLALIWWALRRSPQSFLASYFACVYEVLGAISLLPQLYMFQKDRVASPQLANFVVLIALNRLCTLGFWIVYPWVYYWRYPDNRGIQMLSEFINILIISDFLFYYVRAKIRGEGFVRIPVREELV